MVEVRYSNLMEGICLAVLSIRHGQSDPLEHLAGFAKVMNAQSPPEHCTQILCKNQTISRYLTTQELQEISWYYMRIQLQGESPRA